MRNGMLCQLAHPPGVVLRPLELLLQPVEVSLRLVQPLLGLLLLQLVLARRGLGSLQVLADLVQVGDDLVAVRVGAVQRLLHLLELVVEVLVLSLER